MFATQFLLLATISLSNLQQTTTEPRHYDLPMRGGTVSVELASEITPAAEQDIRIYVNAAADAVTAYVDGFPISHVTLRIRTFHGNGVRRGRTFSQDGGGLIMLSIGDQITQTDLMDDWMLTHEMLHLAFPNMPDDHHWAEEGLSTYAEPIARMRLRQLTEERVWSDMVRDMHQGEPGQGDEGLDNTHTHGRTYWGGALYYMMVDIGIRKRTHNKKGLEYALRAILKEGGNITQDWTFEKVCTVGDKAVGGHVMADLYNKMKDSPIEVDLPSLWKQLGIENIDGKVTFNEKAPLADVRRAISFGTGNKPKK